MDRHLGKGILLMDVFRNSRKRHQKLHLATAHLLGKVRGCGMAEIGPSCVARVVLHLPGVIGPGGLCLRWRAVAGCWGRCSAAVTLLSAVGFVAVNDRLEHSPAHGGAAGQEHVECGSAAQLSGNGPLPGTAGATAGRAAEQSFLLCWDHCVSQFRSFNPRIL